LLNDSLAQLLLSFLSFTFCSARRQFEKRTKRPGSLERIYDSNAATVLTLVEIIAEKFRGATGTYGCGNQSVHNDGCSSTKKQRPVPLTVRISGRALL
jgi:hypothetical protein